MAEEMAPPINGQGAEGLAPESNPAPVDPVVNPESFSWKSRIGEFAADNTLSILPDNETGLLEAAKMFTNAQKLIGAKGVPIPGKDATQDDWNKFYSTVLPKADDSEAMKRFNAAYGVPEDITAYELDKIPVPESLIADDAAFNTSMREMWGKAFQQAGINKQQASIMYKSFGESMQSAMDSMATAHQQLIDAKMEELTNDWGPVDSDGFKAESRKANMAFNKFSTDAEYEHLQAMGYTSDPVALRVFNRVAKGMMEDTALAAGVNVMQGTPEWARAEINKIYGDKSHAFHDKSHPGHDDAVKQLQKLFAMVPD